MFHHPKYQIEHLRPNTSEVSEGLSVLGWKLGRAAFSPAAAAQYLYFWLSLTNTESETSRSRVPAFSPPGAAQSGAVQGKRSAVTAYVTSTG